MRCSIPPDIYDRVHELVVAILNASVAGDDALCDSLCQTLRAYFDEQTTSGRSHPFLTEAMADFTDDATKAARLYKLSLDQSRALPDEPTHTKMISLAQRFIELSLTDQARAYSVAGHAEASRCGDTFWIEEADRLLQELATKPTPRHE